jgi:hypothetical protein
MPTDMNFELECGERYRLAKAQVQAKFPHLAEGTPGWWRAMDNRLKRLRG